MKSECFYVLFNIFLHFVAARKEAHVLPPSFTLCKKNDPNLNDCLKPAIEKALDIMKNGVPEIGMSAIDPLIVTKIEIEEGVNRPVNLKLNLDNVKIFGISDTKLDSVRMYLDEDRIEMDTKIPLINLDGDYVMNGKFLLLPLTGKGKCNMNLTQIEANVKIQGERLEKNGKSYLDVKSFDVHVEKMNNFQVKFDNLFNGNKTLSDNTNMVLNDNWKEIFEELRPSLHDTLGAVFKSISNIVFHKVALKDLFVD